MSKESFKAEIALKGWRMADVACRWDIRPEHLSRIAADSDRDLKWDDLVRALPMLSYNERAAVKAARMILAPTPKKVRRATPVTQPTNLSAQEQGPPPPTPKAFNWGREEDDDVDELEPAYADGFRYQEYLYRGSELVLLQPLEDFAPANSILVVLDVRSGVDAAGGAQEEYRCESPNGHIRWFQPDEIDEWMVTNGKVRDLR